MRLRSGRSTTEVVLAKPKVVLAEPVADDTSFAARLKTCEQNRVHNFTGYIKYFGEWCKILLEHFDEFICYDSDGHMKLLAQSRIHRWRKDNQGELRVYMLENFIGDVKKAKSTRVEIEKTNVLVEAFAQKLATLETQTHAQKIASLKKLGLKLKKNYNSQCGVVC